MQDLINKLKEKVKTNKDHVSPDGNQETDRKQREKTAQQWMPIIDIENSIAYRRDKALVGMIRIQPQNLDLLSDNEKRRKIEALSEGFNGETQGFQIFCIGRPVDLNDYLEWLNDKAKALQDYTRKMILKGYIKQASEMASRGDTTERRFYIILTKKSGYKASSELLQRLNEFLSKLQQAELEASICDDDEILDVYSLFSSMEQASFERTINEYALPPVLDIKGDLIKDGQ